ncbi:response regulator transcription factor [Maridesulfovibrio sp.]|uniref:response regulator transcription factor n=1 Tax=Maridesulfovibrio sp. TaxID=2795000 RepID=UPI002A187DF6|nr:response regulator transcription factor [Maridesulfovibrio sp.]
MPRGSIIIAEDDVEQLETLMEYLSLNDFEVHGAGSALEFFEALIGSDYDVAVVDIGLPDKSGFEVVETLRQRTDMGIIVLTARDSINDKMRGYECGADHYFTKPLDCRELAAAVGSLVERLGSRPEVPIEGAPSNQSAQWRLDTLLWVLTPPAGNEAKLTEKEMNFLRILISEKGSPVTKETLMADLDYAGDELYGAGALAVMVTRLRKKIREQTGLEPPIKTIRSQGYSFSAPAILN